jgi:hypothetical protein
MEIVGRPALISIGSLCSKYSPGTMLERAPPQRIGW